MGSFFRETTGAIIGAVIGYSTGGPAGALRGAAYGASLGYSYRQQRKQRRQTADAQQEFLNQANSLDVRLTGANQSIPFLYGLNYVNPLIVFGKVFNFDTGITLLPKSPQNRPGFVYFKPTCQAFGQWMFIINTRQTLTGITGDLNNPLALFLATFSNAGGARYIQSKILGKAPIAGVSTMTINNIPYIGRPYLGPSAPRRGDLDINDTYFSVIVKNDDSLGINYKNAYNDLDNLVDNNDLYPPENIRHAFATRAAGLVKTVEYYTKSLIDSKPRTYLNSLPNTGYYTRGRLVRNILFDNGEYKLSEDRTETDSHNTALVLLDYLLDEDGPNYKLSDIDLKSFYESYLVCNQVVKKVDIDPGDDQQKNLAFRNSDSQSQIRNEGEQQGTTGPTITIPSSYFKTYDDEASSPDYQKYILHKHEYHGQIYIDELYKDNIAKILDSIPGSQMTLKSSKISLFIPDETKTTDEHVIDTIQDRDLHEYVVIKGAPSDTRANRLTLSYRNVLVNHTEDAVTVDNETYLDEDQQNLLEESDDAPGIIFPDSAKYVAGARLDESRNNIYTFVTKTNKLLLTEGDVVRLRVERQDLNEVVLITSKRTSGSQLQFTAENFDIATYTWSTHVKEETEDE